MNYTNSVYAAAVLALLAAGAPQAEARGRSLASVSTVNSRPMSVKKIVTEGSTASARSSSATTPPAAMRMRAQSLTSTSTPNTNTDGNREADSTTSGEAEVASNYGILSARPDFTYHAPGLRFVPRSTSTTGQINMAVGSARPTGSKRFVPLGEF